MTFAIVLGYLLAYPVLLLISLLLLITLHEGGHAVAALVLMPGPIKVYLGSYGQSDGQSQLRVGRLHVFIKRNLLKWRGGCCYTQPPAILARWRTAVFILAGPLLPLLLASWGFYLGMHYANGPHRVFLLIFLFTASVSALRNLIPSHHVARTPSGQQLGTDGFQLRQLLFPPAQARLAERAATSLAAGNYPASAELYLALLQQTPPTYALLTTTIYILCQTGQYAEALVLSQQQQTFGAELTDDNRFTRALILSRLDQHQAALDAYTALIEQPQPYPMAYNNRGYTYNLLGNYALARLDFDQALRYEAESAYAYCNRGLALLELGEEAAGLADIQHGLALDSANAYGYRNLGIYHLGRGEHAVALRYFEQAQQLDPTTHSLGIYLQKAHQHLAQNAGAGGLMQ
jgi:tetratricopeptide (TPR) repeat protein